MSPPDGERYGGCTVARLAAPHHVCRGPSQAIEGTQIGPTRFDAMARALPVPEIPPQSLGGLAALAARHCRIAGRRCPGHAGAVRQPVLRMHNPGGCNPGCVCCVYPNGNSRCRPPGTCSPGREEVPSGRDHANDARTDHHHAPPTTTAATTTQPRHRPLPYPRRPRRRRRPRQPRRRDNNHDHKHDLNHVDDNCGPNDDDHHHHGGANHHDDRSADDDRRPHDNHGGTNNNDLHDDHDDHTAPPPRHMPGRNECM